MEKEIGAFEAKTRLSELLRDTEAGDSYVILRRGRPVARLVPYREADPGLEGLAASFKEIRGRVKGQLSVRELIDEGRRM